MIKIIKLIHTFIWFIISAAIFYILYAGITDTFNSLVLASIILVGVETVVLLLNRWACPLTTIAENYTSDRSPNFDIYIPKWLAKHNKVIFGTIFMVGIILVIINLFKK